MPVVVFLPFSIDFSWRVSAKSIYVKNGDPKSKKNVKERVSMKSIKAVNTPLIKNVIGKLKNIQTK